MVRLVYVESKYIQYLFKFDKHVMYNKGQKRPYIGILFEVRGHKYYAPLTHPKPKFLTMKNDVDFMRIAGGKYGAINFNNMIPVVDSAVIKVDTNKINDWKYKILLINQIEFFDDHDTEIVDRATKLYKSVIRKTARQAVLDICCNYLLLEQKAKKYDPNFEFKSKKIDK